MSDERQVYSLFSAPFFKFNLHASHESINEKLKKLAYQLKKENGVIKSNRNGYQSNFISNKTPVIKKFVKSINPHFETFADAIGLAKPWTSDNNLPWINISPKGAYNELHSHGEADFSIVYYIEAPKNSGRIRFETPILHLRSSSLKYATHFFNNCPVIDYFPHKYDLIMFPGWLAHSVFENKSDEDRISMAWNVTIKQ